MSARARWLILGFILYGGHRSAALPGDSCSTATDWQPWDDFEPPWVIYQDQNCPSASGGVVDDAAVWQAIYNESYTWDNSLP